MSNEVQCPHCGKGVMIAGQKPMPFWRQEIGCGTLLLCLLIWVLLGSYASRNAFQEVLPRINRAHEQTDAKIANLETKIDGLLAKASALFENANQPNKVTGAEQRSVPTEE